MGKAEGQGRAGARAGAREGSSGGQRDRRVCMGRVHGEGTDAGGKVLQVLGLGCVEVRRWSGGGSEGAGAREGRGLGGQLQGRAGAADAETGACAWGVRMERAHTPHLRDVGG